MKYLLQGALVFSLIVVMGQGCNPAKEARQKASEALLEKAIEKQSDGKVDVDFSENTIDIESKDGEGHVRFGESVKLPSDFPNDVPRYPGANYVSALVSNEGKTAIANFRTTDSPEDVQAWFKSELEGSGFKLDITFQAGASLQLYKKGETKISIQTQADEDKGDTVVSLQRAE